MFEHLYFTDRPLSTLKSGYDLGGDAIDLSGSAVISFGRVFGEGENDDDVDYQFMSKCRPGENFAGCLDVEKEQLSGYPLFFRLLFDKLKDGSELLLFIHGYSHSFEKLTGTVARLHRRYVKNPLSPIKHVLVFSWPSAGNVSRYAYDRKVVETSCAHFLEFILELRRFARQCLPEEERCSFFERINLMAVSMGNYLLERVLQLGQLESDTDATFHEVLHMAADVDNRALHESGGLGKLAKMAKRVHVYFNRNDHLLWVSSGLHRRSRLGKDPHKESLAPEALIIDTTDVSVKALMAPGQFFSKEEMDYATLHNYMLRVEAVVQDANRVLSHAPAQAIDGRSYGGGSLFYLG